jgi:glutathione S-transferase
MMGSRYPKARRAAPQERSSEMPPTSVQLEGCREGARNIQQIWRRNGLFPATSDSRWHDVLCGCGAAVDFDFFHYTGLATHPHRHHCLAALRLDKPGAASRDSSDDIRMYKLYSMQRSGNSYKVRLALALLNAPYHAIEIDILRGESRTPDFLAKNPSGQVPLLEVAEGRYLAESNAILWYVAGGTPLAPESRIERAEALQWMFFEQHALEPNIGAAYFWLSLVRGGRDLQTHALEDWMERGYGALQVMEDHLKTNEFFAAGQITVADIALYGYTHVAGQCDFDLAAFPAIGRWLRRVQQTPGYVAMDWRPDLEVTDSAGIAAGA